MSAAVEVLGVTKQHPGQPSPAVDDVSLRLEHGTRTALLGPSGSGKSTLLRLIAGLDEPSSGRVLINGADMSAVPPERRGIGMLAQRPLLFPHLSVLDNVAFSARAAGAKRTRARADAQPFLELVQMGDFGARNASTLSGGQQQRVAIARSLASHPEVLLLDEPFGALDPGLRDDMYALLDRLREQLPPTILLVTHDRDEAAVVAERIALLEGGIVLQNDTVEGIFHRPSSLAVARLMGGRNAVQGVVENGVHTSDLGRLPVGSESPDGVGVLVVRQEAIRVLAEPARSTPGVLAGVVADLEHRGPRCSVIVRNGAAELVADLPPGLDLRVGDPVSLMITAGSATVVPR